MAGGSKLGSIYVELSLDDKIYKQKLASMPADAQATTKGLETSWRSLGVKTNEYFDNSRRAAENAYQLILKSGKYNSEELIRAEKAKNETIERLNTQQFGKQESLLDKLKSNWIAAAAAIGAAYVAAQKAWNLADQAARYEQSAQAFHSMATSMGKDATTEFEKIRKASGGLIDTQALTEATNKALSLGIPIENIADLMIIARAKARDMGTDTSKAFSDIATGVGRASPLILDNLGLTLKVGTANEEMAKSLGKTVAELTDQEKKTAILNATLAAGKEAVERYDLSQKTTAENMQALKVTLSDLQLMLGQGIVRAAALVVGAFQSISAASLTVSSYIWKIIEAKERLQAMVSWGEAEKRHMEAAGQAASNAASDFKASLEYAKKAQDNFSLMTSRTEDMAGAMIKTTKATGETAKAVDTATGSTKKLADEHSKMVKKQIEDEEKLRKKYDDVNEELESGTRETYKQIYNIRQDEYSKGIKRISDERDKYEALGADKKKLAEWTTSQIAKLEKDLNDKTIKYWQGQEDEWIRIMTAETTAAATANTKQIQYIEKFEDAINDAQDELDYTAKTSIPNVVKANSTLWDDMKTGWKNAEEQCGTFSTNAASVFSTFVSETSGAIGDSLFDFIKGETDSLEDVWSDWCDAILKSFTDAVGNMATSFLMDGMKKMVQYAAEPISMVFSAAWDAASAIVLAGIKALQSFFAWEGGYVRSSGIGAYAYGGNVVPGYASGGDSKSNDTVLALLSPGEYVMPRSAVTPETLPHLEYMRDNKRPRGYAYGGPVDALPGLSKLYGDRYGGSGVWFDEDEWGNLKDAYREIHNYVGMSYYNGRWGFIKEGWDDYYGAYPKEFSAIDDPISHSGQYINERFGYNLQDENGQALGQDDYKYLLDWVLSSGPLMYLGGGEGGDYDQYAGLMNAFTGSIDPNVVWVEPEGDGYRWYMRDGSDRYTSPSSNFFDRWMPNIIKVIGLVMSTVMSYGAGAALAAGATAGTAGSIMGAGSGIAAGFGSAAANIGAAVGAGAYSSLVSYGETGSVTGSLVAGIIAAAAAYATAASGLFSMSEGAITAQVIRKGAGYVLQQALADIAGGSGSVTLSGDGDSGGLGSMDSLLQGLPSLLSGSVSLASGLDYVPYDNFPARLHEGEAVLTKEENRASGRAPVFHIYLDGEEIKGRMRVIADKVFVDRASSGISSMQRVYA